MAYTSKTVYENLYKYQTRLQGVANDLGIKLAAVIAGTDKEALDVLTKEIPKESKKSVQGEMRRLKEITNAVAKVRKKSFDAAKDTIISTSLDVAKAGTSETAKEFNAALGEAARKEREKRFCKTLNDDQLKAIIDGQGIDGATIGEWFDHWQRDDLERISRVVQKATVEQLTVSDIAKQIRGTKENNYSDGILATTRVGAVRLARTVVNGVSNNARVETIKANSDVIDGVKFVGTLDGKTCSYCAAYDGQIWRGEDMASARRPPIHPNCRCTLVPYVELKDEEGNVVDLDADRPAANADFDQLAKDAYNEKAKEKGWSRRFEDLSPSTRLKYYYQAQKDYEQRTGKPAYRQVDSSLSFQDYFKQQPDSFKRSWLGAKRYEAYKEGKLTEKAIFAPDLGYTISPSSLAKFVESEVPEELAKLIKEYEKNGKKSGSNVDSQTEQNENAQASRTLFEIEEQRLAEKREDSWKELFPINNPDSDNHKKIEKLFPKKFIGRQKDTQNTEDGVKIGLRFFARLCDNFGIDVDELNSPVFNRELERSRSRYFPDDNSITMKLCNKKDGDNSAASSAAHEFAHALEYQAKGNLRMLLQSFYESITKRDENGDIVYSLDADGTILKDEGHYFRELTIPVPDLYIRKEYLDKSGNLDGTELLSMYVELMYSTPWLRQDSRYKEFFEGVEKCLKQSRNNK